VLRVSVRWPDVDRLVDLAFDQIRLYARGDLTVSLRMLRALCDLTRTVTDPALQATLAERGRRIVAGCAERFAPGDLRELRLRLATLERLAGGPES
jgi:uncharacterized membrane protein